MLAIRADSTEYVTGSWTVDYDPTGDIIDVAAPAAGETPATWLTADIVDVTADTASGTWTATYRLLIGPAGTVTLTPGVYDWTTRLHDIPEEPVRLTGQLVITAA